MSFDKRILELLNVIKESGIHTSPKEFANTVLFEIKNFLNKAEIAVFYLNHKTYIYNYFIGTEPTDEVLIKSTFTDLVNRGEIARVLREGSLRSALCMLHSANPEPVLIVPGYHTSTPEIMFLVYGNKMVTEDREQYSLVSDLCGLFAVGWKIISQSRTIEELEYQNKILLASGVTDIKNGVKELKYILDMIQTGIILVDSETHDIIDANTMACELLAIPKTKLIGKSRDGFFLITGQTPLSEGNFMNKEVFLHRSNGEFLPVLLTTVSIQLGETKYILESFQDISQRKSVEQNLVQLNVELEKKLLESSRDKRAFLQEMELNAIRLREESEKNALLATAFEYNEIPYLIIDAGRKVLYGNRKFVYTFLNSQNPLTGMDVESILPEITLPEQMFDLNLGQSIHFEYFNKTLEQAVVYSATLTLISGFTQEGKKFLLAFSR